jgi:hypothetical protein
MFGFGEQMKGDSSSWVPSFTFGQIAVVEKEGARDGRKQSGTMCFLTGVLPHTVYLGICVTKKARWESAGDDKIPTPIMVRKRPFVAAFIMRNSKRTTVPRTPLQGNPPDGHRHVKTSHQNEMFCLHVHAKCSSPALSKKQCTNTKKSSRLGQNRNLDVKHRCVRIVPSWSYWVRLQIRYSCTNRNQKI